MRSDTFAAQRALGYHRNHLLSIATCRTSHPEGPASAAAARPRCRASAPKDWSFTYALPISCFEHVRRT